MKPSHIFALQCLLAQHSLAQTSGDTLQRDVVIIGAGSSGSYAAVRLHQMGKSVALVEKANRAGGHTNTYKDPATGQTFDYGTQILVNTTVVTDFFNSLNIPLAPYAPQATGVATDCKRGVPGPPLPVVSPEDSAAALERYKTELAKYPDMFRGYNLPDPVPDDLLLPWGDFLAKYDLGALAYDAWLQFQGMGNILAQPTLYIMKLFNPMQVDARENHRKVAEANHNMQALWDAAMGVLGDSVFLQTSVASIDRQDDCVQVVITTPQGNKTIKASKVLITVPPKVELLRPFLTLTDEENALFSQLNNSYYYNAVVANTGLPEDTSVYDYDQEAPYGLPASPSIYAFNSEGVSELYGVQYSSPEPLGDDFITSDILASAGRARLALGLATPKNATTIVAFNNHSPSGLTVSVDAIRSGFYKRYIALQGQTQTFWTGHAWSSGSSSTIWDYTEHDVLPAIISALGG